VSGHGFSDRPGGRRRALSWAGPVVCGFLICAWVQVTAAPRRSPDTKKSGAEDTISLKLKADVQAGFSPLPITFTGRIKNLRLDDEQFCHAGTFLLRKLVTGQLETVAGEDPACLHDPGKLEVSPTFSIKYVVQNPGVYEFYAMVATNDGRHIKSNGVPVRVVAGQGR